MRAPEESDKRAVGIYVVMARDASDALDMISECEDPRTLDTLYKMLTTKGTESTDQGLNELFVEPVARRLDKLGGSLDQPRKDS